MKKVVRIFISVTFFLGIIAAPAFALTYQDAIDIKFTIDSTLSMSLSDDSLLINNLVPGQSATSNAIDITINTNNAWGYTLTATVGDATKDYRDLKHTDGTAKFSSIAVDSNLSALPTNSGSVWGFSKTTNGTTWANYNGLPKYDDNYDVAELNTSTGASVNATTGFKIGAYAASGQLSGDYTNVINFKAVGNVGKIYMQDVTTADCPKNRTIAYDKRDEKAYYINKIKTGSTVLCWMTTNLDLAGGTALYSDDSNVPEGYSRRSGTPYYTLPASKKSTAGSGGETLYNTGKSECVKGSDCLSYYSFAVATVGTGTSMTSGNTTYDICPKGWRLPTSAEFDLLRNQYTYSELLSNPWYDPNVGYYDYGRSFNASYYTSSTVVDYTYRIALRNDGSTTYARLYDMGKIYALPVRCVAKN